MREMEPSPKRNRMEEYRARGFERGLKRDRREGRHVEMDEYY